jgi:hypothetical protein
VGVVARVRLDESQRRLERVLELDTAAEDDPARTYDSGFGRLGESMQTTRAGSSPSTS